MPIDEPSGLALLADAITQVCDRLENDALRRCADLTARAERSRASKTLSVAANGAKAAIESATIIAAFPPSDSFLIPDLRLDTTPMFGRFTPEALYLGERNDLGAAIHRVRAWSEALLTLHWLEYAVARNDDANRGRHG